MAQCPGSGSNRVVVVRVSDDVELAVSTADGVTPEANGTVGEALAVALPIGVAPPAVVDRVAGLAREESQLPPFSAIANAPAYLHSSLSSIKKKIMYFGFDVLVMNLLRN